MRGSVFSTTMSAVLPMNAMENSSSNAIAPAVGHVDLKGNASVDRHLDIFPCHGGVSQKACAKSEQRLDKRLMKIV